MIRPIALLLLAGPALAQEPVYDPALLPACLDRAGADQVARRDCIGVGAQACMTAEVGATTVGMVSCLQAETAQWDQRLNEAYAAVKADDEQADQEAEGSAAPALLAAQRAWLVWRDAACDYEAARWQGGSIGGPVASDCFMQLTAQQALRMESYLSN